jgi:hypothetical protein
MFALAIDGTRPEFSKSFPIWVARLTEHTQRIEQTRRLLHSSGIAQHRKIDETLKTRSPLKKRVSPSGNDNQGINRILSEMFA